MLEEMLAKGAQLSKTAVVTINTTAAEYLLSPTSTQYRGVTDLIEVCFRFTNMQSIQSLILVLQDKLKKHPNRIGKIFFTSTGGRETLRKAIDKSMSERMSACRKKISDIIPIINSLVLMSVYILIYSYYRLQKVLKKGGRYAT